MRSQLRTVFSHDSSVNLNYLCCGIWVWKPPYYLALNQRQVSKDSKATACVLPSGHGKMVCFNSSVCQMVEQHLKAPPSTTFQTLSSSLLFTFHFIYYFSDFLRNTVNPFEERPAQSVHFYSISSWEAINTLAFVLGQCVIWTTLLWARWRL